MKRIIHRKGAKKKFIYVHLQTKAHLNILFEYAG